ncbi:MAG: HDIG domain-containing protein [Spirochaetales bacterium]|nr:HDIG domain-containing protein [Spirochaetales bacterium]
MKTYTKIHKFKNPSLLPDWIQGKSYIRWVFLSILIASVLTFVIILISAWFDIPFSHVRVSDYKLNELAPETFIVTRNIRYEDEAATNVKKEARAKSVLPVFELKRDVTRKCLKQFELFISIVYNGAEQRKGIEKIMNEIQIELPHIINNIGNSEIEALIKLYPNHEEVVGAAEKILTEVLEKGIFSRLEEIIARNENFFTEGKIDHWRGTYEHTEVPIDKAISMNNLQDWIKDKTTTLPLDEVKKSLVILLVTMFAQENSFYNSEKTEENRHKESEQVEKEYRELRKGEVIVEKGYIVTEEALKKIKIHGESDISLNIYNIIGSLFIVIILYTMAVFLMNKRIIGLRLKKNQILLLICLGFIYLVWIVILTKIPFESEWLPISIYLPTAAFAVVVSLLITPLAGTIFTLIISTAILFVTKMDANAFIFAFLSGIAGCIVTIKTEKMIDLIIAGLFLSLFNSFVLLTLGLLRNFHTDEIFVAIGLGSFNGFSCGLLGIGLLILLEHMMNLASRFRLLELSDLNSPIFKKMLTRAPGTYNHSVMMAHLAETACTEIGANPLLARVGAYYHDIGKMDQPEYFIENQTHDNKHDELKPSLSIAVIKSHVKIGVEKAKELNLPEEVIDIIAQHHGKGLITYFYHRAMSENKNEKISSDDYKYPGERPKSKEAAVVLLADVVEAASRTLKRPTVGKLEKYIWKIIMDKFTTGELSECQLTFNELETIKKSFVQILSGYFHSRIEYPKVKEIMK